MFNSGRMDGKWNKDKEVMGNRKRSEKIRITNERRENKEKSLL